jgi:trigger factor
MEVKLENTETGRAHVNVSLSADEMDAYFKMAEEAVREEGDLSPELARASLEEFCADTQVQNKLRGYVMELVAIRAVKEAQVAPASQLLHLTKDTVSPGKGFEFIVSVVPTPVVELASYDPIEAYEGELLVTEEEIEKELAELALRSASIVPKDAASIVEFDDFIEIETEATRDGEEYEHLTAKKRLYKVGEKFLPEDFDKNIVGMKVGETKSFSLVFDKDRSPVEVTITILGIYTEVAPQADDDWIEKKFPGLGGLDGLKARIRKEITEKKKPAFDEARTATVLKQLAQRVTSPVPEIVFETRFAEMYRNFCKDIKNSQGMGIEEYFYKQGITEQQVKEEMARDIRTGLMEGFALDAYARHYELIASEEDYDQVLRSIAPGDEEATRYEYAVSGRTYVLDEAALRNSALRHLLDTAVASR